jgi:CDP-diacylglycerol--glycerol-3-phosphate 3-phosphatidyltransferase
MMAAARAALGPLLIAGTACNWSGMALAGMVLGALVSDIFDGALARRWHCDTAAVRLFDTMADTFFYVCVGVALWVGRPEILRGNGDLMVALLATEAARFGLDFAKFGKPASYHTYLAKGWGLLMAVAVMTALAWPAHSAWLVGASLAAGILCNAEGLWMSVVLPVWTRDVKGLGAALKIRATFGAPGAARLAVTEG